MDLVVYDTHTTNTVATMASFETAAYQTDGRMAYRYLANRIINETGSLSSGSLAARLVVRLSTNTCAEQASISAGGQFTIATASASLPLNLKKGTVRTHSRQLRSVDVTGSGSSTDPASGFSGSVSNVTSAWTTGGNLTIGGGSTNGSYGSLIVTNGGGVFIGNTGDSLSIGVGNGTIPVINIGPGLNIGNGTLTICTNELTADAVASLLSNVTGAGTINLTNCATLTTAP